VLGCLCNVIYVYLIIQTFYHAADKHKHKHRKSKCQTDKRIVGITDSGAAGSGRYAYSGWALNSFQLDSLTLGIQLSAFSHAHNNCQWHQMKVEKEEEEYKSLTDIKMQMRWPNRKSEQSGQRPVVYIVYVYIYGIEIILTRKQHLWSH